MQNTRLAFLFLLIPAFLFAQKNKPDEKTVKLFSDAKSVKWVRYFSGRIDDVSDVHISLASDGTAYKGYLTYTSSGDEFRLDGTEKEGLLYLTEWDATSRKTATLEVNLSEQTLRATWQNHDGSIGAALQANEVESLPESRSFCGDNKWINRYKSSYQKASLDLILNRSNNGQISGSIWVEAEGLYLDVQGTAEENGNFSARLSQSQNKDATGSIKGSLADVKKLEATVILPPNRKHVFQFELVENMIVGCQNAADYTSTYDILFPKTKCASCNNFIEKQVDLWLSECRNKTKSKNIIANPDTRAALRASCWSEIQLWDDRYISGLLMFSSTWDSAVQIKPFTFDVQRNKTLDLEDLFIKKFNSQSWLKAFAKKESPKLMYWENDSYRAWVKKAEFPILTMRQDGFLLSTDFHPIFGRAEVLVPWADVKPYLRKSAVRDLVQG